MANTITLSEILSEAPAAPLTGSEPFETVQGGTTVAATTAQLADFARRAPVNNQSGTSYTLALSDAGKVVRQNNGASITTTVPKNDDAAFPVGTVIPIRQVGAGEITAAGDTGVTLNVPAGFLAKTARQGATIMLHKVGPDEWDVTGDLAASS